MIINSIEWREQNLRNSVISEKNIFEQLLYIKKQIEYLNTLAYHNIVAKFQLDMAKKEGKKFFTDRYKMKLAETKSFPKNKYSVTIENHYPTN